MPISTLPALEPMVLVVYVNFGVGGAIAQRLMGSAVVSLASAASALDGLVHRCDHDVMALCPYLRVEERARPLEQGGERERPLPVIEVVHGRDPAGGVDLVVHRHQEQASARLVLAALTPIAA